MIRIDFNNIKPDFINGDIKWYSDKDIQNYIEKKQAFNLPKLKGFYCFIVKNILIEDYVLIDDKQNVIAYYHYNLEGYQQMLAKINIIKIAKYFNKI